MTANVIDHAGRNCYVYLGRRSYCEIVLNQEMLNIFKLWITLNLSIGSNHRGWMQKHVGASGVCYHSNLLTIHTQIGFNCFIVLLPLMITFNFKRVLNCQHVFIIKLNCVNLHRCIVQRENFCISWKIFNWGLKINIDNVATSSAQAWLMFLTKKFRIQLTLRVTLISRPKNWEWQLNNFLYRVSRK